MVTHIVLIKLQHPIEENIINTTDQLKSMEGQIKELRYIEVGQDQYRSERSFDISLITRFDSWEDLDTYRSHPYHQSVLAFLKTVMETSKTVDYEHA